MAGIRDNQQSEIASLRLSLEAVDTEKEGQMFLEYQDSLQRLKDGHLDEVSAKNEQLEKLSEG